MSEHDTPARAASGVLLATDLGSRCDRATDRASVLASALGGPAIAASIVEDGQLQAQNVPRHDLPPWYHAPSPQARAEQRLRREFTDTATAWEVRVGEGDAGQQLSAILDERSELLVVAGPARQGVLGPVALGSTVDRLLRRPDIALLMVRERMHTDYGHLLVASDFSAPSRAALRRAHALFPQARVTLLHGFQVPMLGLMDTAQEAAIAQARRQLREEGLAFLRDCALKSGAAELLVEHGEPARLVQQYVDTFAPGLVVVGTHGHGAVYELVVGSVARRIITTTTADTLVVRG